MPISSQSNLGFTFKRLVIDRSLYKCVGRNEKKNRLRYIALRLPLMSKPTADWERVGDRFYRKIQLYSSVFDPDLELENYRISGAPLSGALGRESLSP